MKGIFVAVALFSLPGMPKHREFLTSNYVAVAQPVEAVASDATQYVFESHQQHQLGKLNGITLMQMAG